MENQQNDPIWKLAEKRVAFKRSLAFYFVINLFLVGVWYLTIGKEGGRFWPIWPILASGLGVVMQYIRVYHTNSDISVDKEYEKLKNNMK